MGRRVSQPVPSLLLDGRQQDVRLGALLPSRPTAPCVVVDTKTWKIIKKFENIGPDCQTMSVTYDGKYVLQIFSGFQRLSSGLFVFTQDTLEPVGYHAQLRRPSRLRDRADQGGAPEEQPLHDAVAAACGLALAGSVEDLTVSAGEPGASATGVQRSLLALRSGRSRSRLAPEIMLNQIRPFGLFARLAVQNLGRQPARTFLLALAVAVCVAALFATLTVRWSSRRACRSASRAWAPT